MVTKAWVASALVLLLVCGGCGGDTQGDATAGPSAPTSTPPAATPPKPLEGATITVTDQGFVLDAQSAASFALGELQVYQGARLTFVNRDVIPHDILSDPPQRHDECPEINAAGYLVPGQSRSTAPLDRIVTCRFHDHGRENDPRYGGKVTAVPR
jgi:hypothetical protein